MDTAPRDGTRIMAWANYMEHDRPLFVSFKDGEWRDDYGKPNVAWRLFAAWQPEPTSPFPLPTSY